MNERTTRRIWRRAAAAAALLALLSADAWGARVRVVLPDGASYIGEWEGSGRDQFRIRLDDGSERQLALAGGVIVMTIDAHGAASPRPESVLRLRAGLDALDLGMTETAEENMRAAITLSPKYADAHYALAQLLESQEDAKAWDHYVWAAKLNPQRYPVGGKVRAVVEKYAAQGDYFAAGRECARFAVNFTEDPSAGELAYRGAKYLLAAKEDPDIGGVALQESLAAYEFALQNHPDRPEAQEARSQLGWLYVQTKQADKAIASLTAAIQELLLNDPASSHAARMYLTLGYAYFQKGDMARVTDAVERALAFNPDDETRQEANLLYSEIAWSLFTAENGLPSNDIFSLTADGSTLLVGASKGVARVNMDSVPPKIEANFLGSEEADGVVIRAVAADENEIWAGSSGQGVFRHNKATGDTTQYLALDGLAGNRVDAIAMDERAVWVGGLGGVARYDRQLDSWRAYTSQNGRIFRESDQITSLAMDDNFLWVGSIEKGVLRYNRNAGADGWSLYASADGLPSKASIHSLSILKNSVMATWQTETEKGYAEWDPASNRWLSAAFGGGSGTIWSAAHEGTLWLAVNGALVSRSPSRDWSRGNIPYSRSLEGAAVHSILKVGNMIWMATDKGLARVDASRFSLSAQEEKQ